MLNREIALLLRWIRRWWWLMLLPAVVVGGLVAPQILANEQPAAGGFRAEFRYSAAQESSNLETREGDYQDVWLASEFLVNAFTDVVQGSAFRDDLRAAVDDPSIVDNLSIAADNNRSIGVVFLGHPAEEALRELANAAVTVLQTQNADYFPHLGGESATVTIIDAPVVRPAPPSVPGILEPLLQIGVAFFVGIVLALLAAYFDQGIRNTEDLQLAGFDVLGVIPKR